MLIVANPLYIYKIYVTIAKGLYILNIYLFMFVCVYWLPIFSLVWDVKVGGLLNSKWIMKNI